MFIVAAASHWSSRARVKAVCHAEFKIQVDESKLRVSRKRKRKKKRPNSAESIT